MSNKPNSFSKIEEKEIPIPSPIKPEYKDAPIDQFFPLDDVLPPEFYGCYMGNKLCHILSTKTGKIRKNLKGSKYSVYPQASISNGKYKKLIKLHILFSKKFLINDDPKNKTIVDHCDRNPLNVSLLNFRWSTIEENNRNTRSKNRDRYLFRVFSLDDVNLENPLYEIPFSKLSHSKISYIGKVMKAKERYKNQQWIKVDLELENYRKQWGDPHPGEWNPLTCRGWKTSRLYPWVKVNTNGYLLINNVLTPGNRSSNDTDHSYYNIKLGKDIWSVHRLIFTEFHNTLLTRKDNIDHYNGVYIPCVYNSIFNLRRTDAKGNMNNPKTKEKRYKKVSKIDPDTGIVLKIYNSLDEACFKNSIPRGSLSNYCKGKRYLCAGYLWSYYGEEKERWEKYKEHEIYLENTRGCKPCGYWVVMERCIKVAKLCKTRTQFIRNYPGAFLSMKAAGIDQHWFPSIKKDNIDDKK